MSSAKPTLAAEDLILQSTSFASSKSGGDLGGFLFSLATMLRESVIRLEETAGRVSELVIAHTGRADPGLIVALQDFDRLQQEFSALSDVLSRMGATTAGPWPATVAATDLKHELLKTVTITELKQRLSLHFEQSSLEPEIMAPSDDGLLAEF